MTDHNNAKPSQTNSREIKEVIKTERYYSKIISQMTYTLAEHKIKNQLTNKFASELYNYTNILSYYKNYIAELKSKKSIIENKIQKSVNIISELKDKVSNLIYYYKKVNIELNYLLKEINSLLYDYTEHIEKEKIIPIVKNKKREVSKIFKKLNNIELECLKKEQQRLLIESEISPDIEKIQSFEQQIRLLENEKSQKEMTDLLLILKRATQNNHEDNDIVDKNNSKKDFIDINLVEGDSKKFKKNNL